MSTIVQYLVGHTYRPILMQYLSRERIYRHKGIRLRIPPEVFHPRFFSSTRILLNYISKTELKGKSLLELGAGSGLIAMHAARSGAEVTATDINPVAIRFLQLNAESNKIPVSVRHSDLFDSLVPQKFDFIIINPPYYKKNPVTERDHAWYCGENGEYFQKLFRQLGSFMPGGSEVLMILCDGCDLQMVQNYAQANGMEMHCVHTVRTLIEKNFIFKITIQDESR